MSRLDIRETIPISILSNSRGVTPLFASPTRPLSGRYNLGQENCRKGEESSMSHPLPATVYHRETCRLCDSANTEKVVELEPIPLAEKYLTQEQLGQATDVYPIDLYQCLDCGHVQLLDVIDPEVLWKDYTYHSGQTQGIVDHFREVAATILQRHQPAPNSLVVDIGSNDGTLLRPFQEAGLRVLGVDPAEAIAQAATDSGVETIPKLFSPGLAQNILELHGAARVVTAFNVFAHTDDMAAMAEGIRILLAPEGVFYFEAQYLLDIIDKTLLGTIFHEHMCHHSVKPMKSFLARHGMELVGVERNTIQNGSVLGAAQLSGGPLSVQSSVQELLDLEEERKLDHPEAIRALGAKLDAMSRDASRLVAEWKKDGATVAAYGAARSGPTFINQLGLGKVIQFVVDDHPQKVDRYTPGHQIKVLPTTELLERMPDYTIILAWIHAKKIIAKNREYLEKGGKFVVCCPEVQVVSLADLD